MASLTVSLAAARPAVVALAKAPRARPMVARPAAARKMAVMRFAPKTFAHIKAMDAARDDKEEEPEDLVEIPAEVAEDAVEDLDADQECAGDWCDPDSGESDAEPWKLNPKLE